MGESRQHTYPKPFDFGAYYYQKTGQESLNHRTFEMQSKTARLNKLVDMVVTALDEESQRDTEINAMQVIDRHTKARAGEDKEAAYYKSRIEDYLQKNNLMHIPIPSWYPNLVEATFQEGWGFAGLSEWIYAHKYAMSTSAKIKGEKIFFADPKSGQLKLMPQTMTLEKLNKIVDVLYENAVHKKRTYKADTLYMANGIRVQIFDEKFTKPGQLSLIFRKYIVKVFTFEEQVKWGTIDPECPKFLKAAVQMKANQAITGAVKTAKTTYFTTMEQYERELDDGVMVERDPEIPYASFRPNSPVLELVVEEDEDLADVMRHLMRSDADRLMMAEARDPLSMDTAIKAGNKGTRGVKITYHTTDPVDFISTAADEITTYFGNTDYANQALKVAKAFNLVHHLTNLNDKSKKRLAAIYEIDYDVHTTSVRLVPICLYDKATDSWTWHCFISERLRKAAMMENERAFHIYEEELERLSKLSPMKEPRPIELGFIQKGILRG